MRQIPIVLQTGQQCPREVCVCLCVCMHLLMCMRALEVGGEGQGRGVLRSLHSLELPKSVEMVSGHT